MNRRVSLVISIVGLNLMACCCGGFGKNADANKPQDDPKTDAKQTAKKPSVFDDRVKEWLTPTKAANVDGFKVELVSGSFGKLKLDNRLSKDSYFQVRLRVTNDKPSTVLNYTGKWDRLMPSVGVVGPKLIDEFDNVYGLSHYTRFDLAEFRSAKDRVDPGKSIEDVLAFEVPLETAKELHLELGCSTLQQPSTVIGFKLPRSFFEKK